MNFLPTSSPRPKHAPSSRPEGAPGCSHGWSAAQPVETFARIRPRPEGAEEAPHACRTGLPRPFPPLAALHREPCAVSTSHTLSESPIRSPKSQISNPNSEIPNLKSEISNLKSQIPPSLPATMINPLCTTISNLLIFLTRYFTLKLLCETLCLGVLCVASRRAIVANLSSARSIGAFHGFR